MLGIYDKGRERKARKHIRTMTTYEKLFFKAFNCLPNESKALEEYSKDELIRLINILRQGIETLSTIDNKPDESDDYGLGIVASTEAELQSFQEFCAKNYLPISKNNCHVSLVCNQDMIDRYLSTAIHYQRTDYAMFIILKDVQHSQLSSFTLNRQFSSNNRIYKYQLKILVQDANESHEDFLHKIRCQLLGEIFFIDRDDHESIPSLPAPKEPQFVSISAHTQIACWPLPGRRDLSRFRKDLGVTHILSLINDKELKNTKICGHVESAGIQSLHLPIEGAELSVFTSSQDTVDLLIERVPSIRELLLNSTEAAPVKMIIHCAAGLHRTGAITYLLLRLCHFNSDQALLIINRTRSITARQVGQKRIDAVECNLLNKIP